MIPGGYQWIRLLAEEAQQVEPAERTAFLDERCAGNPELRSQVERLLKAEPGDFLIEPCPLPVVYAARGEPADLPVGGKIGW
jgi:hypothetical protein